MKLAETEIELLGAIVANVLLAVTTGGEVSIATVKLVALVPVTPPTVTVIAPVVAPEGTEVVILVAVLAVTVAVVPLNFTVLFAGVALKFVPVIVTEVPTAPLVGVKLVMVGVEAVVTVKLVALVPVCPPTVTVIPPDVAPVGTDVVILVAALAVTVAVVPLNFTVLLAGVALKFVPAIVTEVPTAPLVGVKLVIVGEGTNVKPASVAVPPGVVTDTLPEVPEPTTAVMLVAETTLNDVAGVPPKLTAIAPVKLVPVKATVVPLPALVGFINVIVGAGINVKPVRVAVPPGVLTLTLPEVPDATTAVMLVAETTLNDVAAVPPKLTAVAPVKLVPVKVTVVPLPALVGAKLMIVGAETNVKPARVAVPPGVMTDTLPEVPDATTAVMLVAETTLNDVAGVPPKLIAVAPVKFVPVMVTEVPTAPLVGVKLVMVGEAVVIVKLVPLVPVSPPTVTVIAPVVAPIGTDVVMLVAVLAVAAAVVPVNCTMLLAGVALKLVPVIVTDVPIEPEVGVKEVIVGVVVAAIVLR